MFSSFLILSVVIAFCTAELLEDFSLRPTHSFHWSSLTFSASAHITPAIHPDSSYTSSTATHHRTCQSPEPTVPTQRWARNHTIDVGAAGDLIFRPNSINATVGDIISFNFLSLNHTLTRSRFQDPCRKNSSFDTGFNQFNPNNITGKFNVQYQVDSLDPQWFFCAQTVKKSHCAAGMVFSLNARGKEGEFFQNARNQSRSNITSTRIVFQTGTRVTSFRALTNPSLSPVSDAGRSSTIILTTGSPLISMGCICREAASTTSDISNVSRSVGTGAAGGQNATLTASPIISNNSWKRRRVIQDWGVLLGSVVILAL